MTNMQQNYCSKKRKSLGKTKSQLRSCVPKTRFVLILLAAAASKWVLLNNRKMLIIYVTPSAPDVDRDISPGSSGHHDHSVDAREGTAAPKRADDASEMAVPGGSGGHFGQPFWWASWQGFAPRVHHTQTPSTPRADSSKIFRVRIRGRRCFVGLVCWRWLGQRLWWSLGGWSA